MKLHRNAEQCHGHAQGGLSMLHLGMHRAIHISVIADAGAAEDGPAQPASEAREALRTPDRARPQEEAPHAHPQEQAQPEGGAPEQQTVSVKLSPGHAKVEKGVAAPRGSRHARKRGSTGSIVESDEDPPVARRRRTGAKLP